MTRKRKTNAKPKGQEKSGEEGVSGPVADQQPEDRTEGAVLVEPVRSAEGAASPVSQSVASASAPADVNAAASPVSGFVAFASPSADMGTELIPIGPPLFGDDHALWIAFRATRSAVRALIGEDQPQGDPQKLADQAVCMADFLRSAPGASDEAVVTQLSMRGKARGGDDTLRFKVRVFRDVLAHAERHLREAEPPAPTDAELAAKAAKPDPRDLSLKLVKAPLALTETAKGR